MDKVLENMTTIASEKLKAYKSDFDIDKEMYAEYPIGTPMIWTIGDTGTWLIPLKDHSISSGDQSFAKAKVDMYRSNNEWFYLETGNFIVGVTRDEAMHHVENRPVLTLYNFPKGKSIRMEDAEYLSLGNHMFLELQSGSDRFRPAMIATKKVSAGQVLEMFKKSENAETMDRMYPTFERNQLLRGDIVVKKPFSLTATDEKRYESAQQGMEFIRMVTPTTVRLYSTSDINFRSRKDAGRRVMENPGEVTFYLDRKGGKMLEIDKSEAFTRLEKSREKAVRALSDGSLITTNENGFYMKQGESLVKLNEVDNSFAVITKDAVPERYPVSILNTEEEIKSKKFFSKKEVKLLMELETVYKPIPRGILFEEGKPRSMTRSL